MLVVVAGYHQDLALPPQEFRVELFVNHVLKYGHIGSPCDTKRLHYFWQGVGPVILPSEAATLPEQVPEGIELPPGPRLRQRQVETLQPKDAVDPQLEPRLRTSHQTGRVTDNPLPRSIEA